MNYYTMMFTEVSVVKYPDTSLIDIKSKIIVTSETNLGRPV